jgi:O-acetyl-ADP-ribose deacetylase (regulator of RNase III)
MVGKMEEKACGENKIMDEKNRITYKGVSIELYEGDICKLEVDAIVNAANNRFWMGGGVAGAIKRAGGEIIEKEAVKQGPKPVGEVVVTTAGKLPAKYVIHAAVMGQDLITDEDKIATATHNTLSEANKLKVKSIAFPAFGTGVGGFPFDKCAEVMFSEVKKFIDGAKNISLGRIIFALYGREAYEVFSKKVKEIFLS